MLASSSAPGRTETETKTDGDGDGDEDGRRRRRRRRRTDAAALLDGAAGAAGRPAAGHPEQPPEGIWVPEEIEYANQTERRGKQELETGKEKMISQERTAEEGSARPRQAARWGCRRGATRHGAAHKTGRGSARQKIVWDHRSPFSVWLHSMRV